MTQDPYVVTCSVCVKDWSVPNKTNTIVFISRLQFVSGRSDESHI